MPVIIMLDVYMVDLPPESTLNPRLARQFLEAGADPMLPVNGETRALEWIAAYGTVEMAQLFIDFGADPSAKTKLGLNSIQIARSHGHHKMATLLQRAVKSEVTVDKPASRLERLSQKNNAPMMRH